MAKLRRFFLLDSVQRTVVAQAILLPPLISAGIRTVGVARVQGILRRWASRSIAPPSASATASLVLFAASAQRSVQRSTGIGGTCLVRSLTLWTLLLRQGIHSDLRLGYRRAETGIEGHAWIELDQIPINERPAEVDSYVAHPQPLSFDWFLR